MIEQDRAEILKLHRDWWAANVQMDIELMQTCFPVGMNYLMFNYNWHPYFGIDEKIRLWKYYKTLGVSLTGPPDVRILKFEVIGDLAYIADEFEVCTAIATDAEPLVEEVQPLPLPGESAAERGRATEIYKRDDGEGRPIWKMWHFHCSPLPPADALRPGFSDSAQSRGGIGWNPWGEPLCVIGPGRD